MLNVVTPHMTCICDEAGFPEALEQGFSQIYIVMRDGSFMKHHKLSDDRFIRMKIKALPAHVKYTEEVASVQEEINFLPAGKIPVSFLHQITKFFKEVMSKMKNDYEAQCFILWSQEKGYHISVPKQSVSKAAVSFEYDADAIPAGSVVVVDIHSHNTMGAFFSGTDDNNDKNGIYYSGVIGQLNKPEPAMIFRLNLFDTKKSATLADVFEYEHEKVEIDPTWLDKVEAKVHTPVTHRGMGTMYQGQFDMGSSWQSRGGFSKKPGKVQLGFIDRPESQHRPLQDRSAFASNAERAAAAFKTPADDEAELDRATAAAIRAMSADLLDDLDDDLLDPVGDMTTLGELSPGEYDSIASDYGVDMADAIEDADGAIATIVGNDVLPAKEKDELLLDVIRNAYAGLSSTGQDKMATQGL